MLKIPKPIEKVKGCRDEYREGFIDGEAEGMDDAYFAAREGDYPWEDRVEGCSAAYKTGYKAGYKRGRLRGNIYYKGYLRGFRLGTDAGYDEASFRLSKAYAEGKYDDGLTETAGYKKALMDSEWAVGMLYTLLATDKDRFIRITGLSNPEEVIYTYGMENTISLLKAAGIADMDEELEEIRAMEELGDIQNGIEPEKKSAVLQKVR